VKEFEEPRVTIEKGEYEQLQECKRIVEHLWEIYGPYNFPKDLDTPFEARGDAGHRFPRSVNSRIRALKDFDDSE
jgi:hypothetical protein